VKVETLQERYERLCREPNDISEHLPVLFGYASRSRSIVELGVRSGNSTTALLAGLSASALREFAHWPRLDSVDIVASTLACDLSPLAPDVAWRLHWADSLKFAPLPCDLLFIDTLHTRAQLAAELSRHAGHARKWILLHDTTTFGDAGEDGGEGLWPAVIEFLAAGEGRWRIAKRFENQNGLTVLERVQAIQQA
jgi:hypothetical protein